MSGLLALITMCSLLAFGAFAVGMIPLSFVLSKQREHHLQSFATGLLLGTALGVIIPEGIELLASSHPPSELPVSKIALSLLLGFAFMLVVEQLHSHSHTPHAALPLQVVGAELEGPERRSASWFAHPDPAVLPSQKHANPLTLGLLVHGLADGLALGVSSLSTTEAGAPSSMSLVVFLALLIHKGVLFALYLLLTAMTFPPTTAPTALALTTSLLATNLSRAGCRYRLAAFSASTPVGALVSYGLFSLLGASEGKGDWTGLAMLLSGGSFLYVATALQPVSSFSSLANEGNVGMRVILVVFGMFVPFTIGYVLGHGHDRDGSV